MVHVSNNFMIRVVITALITIFFVISLYGYCKAGIQKNIKINLYGSIISQSPPDTIIQILTNMNLDYYHGKPVDTLLAHLPVGIIDMKIRGWHNLRRADVLYVSYPNNVFLAIFVNKFKFMNPNGAGNNPPSLNWDLVLFKKEDISYIIAFNGTQCLNGCQYRYK
jgi:hypothetical protein